MNTAAVHYVCSFAFVERFEPRGRRLKNALIYLVVVVVVVVVLLL